MHKISIPQSVTDRVVARRGREHIFEDLDPARTALVVVDMQNGFMLPEVAHAPCAAAIEIVPNINRLAAAVRATGGTVVWIQTAFTEETLSSWSTLYGMVGPAGTAKRKRSLSLGGKGYDLWPELKVESADMLVEKLRYSAFIQGSSDLDRQLRSRGLDTLLITGTVTNVCCESTARDAMMLNYKVIMVTDGNAAANDDDQRLARQFLSDLRRHHVDRFRDRLPVAKRPQGPRRGGIEDRETSRAEGLDANGSTSVRRSDIRCRTPARLP